MKFDVNSEDLVLGCNCFSGPEAPPMSPHDVKILSIDMVSRNILSSTKKSWILT